MVALELHPASSRNELDKMATVLSTAALVGMLVLAFLLVWLPVEVAVVTSRFSKTPPNTASDTTVPASVNVSPSGGGPSGALFLFTTMWVEG